MAASRDVLRCARRFVVLFVIASQWIAATDGPVSADVTWLVSGRGGSTAPLAGSAAGSASADGRFVVVHSSAPYLVPGVLDSNDGTDLFLWDRLTGGLVLISRSADSPSRTANAASSSATISADGAFVAFRSSATDLLPPQTGTPGEQIYLWERASSNVRLVTHAPGLPDTWDRGGDAYPVALSADGRFLVFQSTSSTLVQWMPTQSITNVFIWDRVSGDVSLVSRAPGPGPLVLSGNADSYSTSISADGRFIAFASGASNLISGATDGAGTSDVFLWDRESGAITLVSHALGRPTRGGNYESFSPRISCDGGHVAFISRATDISPSSVTPIFLQAYLWDRATGAVRLVSHSPAGAAADGDSLLYGISAEGRFVLTISWATNLVPSPAQGLRAGYLWDRQDGSIRLVTHQPGSPTTPMQASAAVLSFDGSSVAFVEERWSPPVAYAWSRAAGDVRLVSHQAGSPSAVSDGESRVAGISADGRFVSFTSTATNLLPGGMLVGGAGSAYQWDGASGEVALLAGRPPAGRTSRGSTAFALSANGRFVAFSSRDGAQSWSDPENVYLWDRATGEETLVTHVFGSPTVPSRGMSVVKAISEDGEFVLFDSRATDLLGPGSDVYLTQVFVWQRSTGLVRLVSRIPRSPLWGVNRRATARSMTPDGAYVLFGSDADNVIAGGLDTNGAEDVFLWERATGNVSLVSHAFGAPLVAGRRYSYPGAMTADGRVVIFGSHADNLIPSGDLNGASDVFAWDRSNGVVTIISRKPSSPNSSASGWHSPVAVSDDGSMVVFVSNSTDMVSGLQNPNFAVNSYLWRRSTGAVQLITHAAGAPTLAVGGFARAISPDGAHVVVGGDQRLDGGSPFSGTFLWAPESARWTRIAPVPADATSTDASRVLFSATSTSAVAGQVDRNGEEDLFVWDRTTARATLVSHAARDRLTTGDRGTGTASMSRDGRFVAFMSAASDLVVGEFWPRADNVFLWFAGSGVPPAITSPAEASVTAQAPSSFQVTATGDPSPALLIDSPLPEGLALVDHGDGTATLEGAPASTASGVHLLTVRAVNGFEPSATQALTLTIRGAPRFTSGTSASFVPGRHGTFTVATAGYPAASLAPGGALPEGLSFVDQGGGTGVLSGVASSGSWGRYPIRWTAQNGFPPDAVQNFVVTVDSGAFATVPPCRVFDSRLAADGPALASGVTRVVQLAGRCGVPATARSVALNVTAVAASGGGVLQAFAGDQAPPPTIVVAFGAGQTRASNAIAQLALDGSGTLALQAIVADSGTVDAVVDVSGYFE